MDMSRCCFRNHTYVLPVKTTKRHHHPFLLYLNQKREQDTSATFPPLFFHLKTNKEQGGIKTQYETRRGMREQNHGVNIKLDEHYLCSIEQNNRFFQSWYLIRFNGQKSIQSNATLSARPYFPDYQVQGRATELRSLIHVDGSYSSIRLILLWTILTTGNSWIALVRRREEGEQGDLNGDLGRGKGGTEGTQ